MSEWKSRYGDIVDNHVHMGNMEDEAHMLQVLEVTGIAQMGLVSVQNPASGSGLSGSIYMKARHPETFWVLAGLNHAQVLTDGKVKTTSLAAQVDAFVAAGCDGLKMVEGKPTSRQTMDIPITDAYFADYWARVEELHLPIVWHVNDPEEFWDPVLMPAWAREKGWGYGPDDVEKETLYAEVAAVLDRHPGLIIVFPHFYFLSADLPRASRFLDEHPNVSFDLAPGIEFLHNLSNDVDETREFMVKYADRIIYGTDLSSRWTIEESICRAGIVYRWLETEDAFPVPLGVDMLLGTPDDGLIKGLALGDDVLDKIYRTNFRKLVGDTPKPLCADKAVDELQRIASYAEAMSGMAASETDAGKVAQYLSEG